MVSSWGMTESSRRSRLAITPVLFTSWGDVAQFLREEYRAFPLNDVGLGAIDLMTQVLHQLSSGKGCSIVCDAQGEVAVMARDDMARRQYGCWRWPVEALELALSASWIFVQDEIVVVTLAGITAVDSARAAAGFSLFDSGLEYLIDEYARSALGECFDRRVIPDVLVLSDLQRRDRNSDWTKLEVADETLRFRSYRDGREIGVPAPAYPISLIDRLAREELIMCEGDSAALSSEGAAWLKNVKIAAESRLFGE